MSNYLTRLVARTIAPVALRPRTRLRFEDAPALQPMPEETAAANARPPRMESQPTPIPMPPRETGEPWEPVRETRSVAPMEEPRPRVSLELPRIEHDQAPRMDATPASIASPPPLAPQRETVILHDERVIHTRENILLHDERVLRTREHADRTPIPAEPKAEAAQRSAPQPLSLPHRAPQSQSPQPPVSQPAVPAPRIVRGRAAARAASAPPPPAPASEPAIHVSIGRIEVRATTQSASPRRREGSSALTLDAYLERRNGKSGR